MCANFNLIFFIFAANNKLTGTVPEVIGNLERLREINLREYSQVIIYLFY